MLEDKDTRHERVELSTAWLELLGKHTQATSGASEPVPSLQSDPWSSLVQSNGIRAFDVQAVHLHMSDEDIEQLLSDMRDMQDMRDQSTSHPGL